jgi:poly-gamma-glutamate capsule biosynthesis protein CapA/YwtB (metallophosphatase superfamily)
MKVVIAGDVSDWNIPGFSVQRLPSSLLSVISDADLLIANLEGLIGLPAGGISDLDFCHRPALDWMLNRFLDLTKRRQPRVHSSANILSVFARARRSCATLAHNHVKDLGADGLVTTLDHLQRESILSVGAGVTRAQAETPCRITVAGREVVVLNYNWIGLRRGGLFLNIYGAADSWYGAAYKAPHQISQIIRSIRESSPGSLIILVLHAGRALAVSPGTAGLDPTALRGIGADFTIVHHSHRHLECDVPGVFLLGDFVFRHPGYLPEDRVGSIVAITVKADGAADATLHKFRFSQGYPCMPE